MRFQRLIYGGAGTAGVGAVVLVGWACSMNPRDVTPRIAGPVPTNPTPIQRSVPTPSLEPDIAPDHTNRALTKLRLGMPRTEVENLFGGPAARISPVNTHDGAITYSMVYEVHASSDMSAHARTIVTLEFDATKPGHPLLTFRTVLPTS